MLVLAEPEVNGRAQAPLVRPLHERDLRNELRLDPHDVPAADARHLRHLGERRVRPRERLQELQQALDLGVAVPGADVPRPAQPAGLVNGHDERAEAAARRPSPFV